MELHFCESMDSARNQISTCDFSGLQLSPGNESRIASLIATMFHMQIEPCIKINELANKSLRPSTKRELHAYKSWMSSLNVEMLENMFDTWNVLESSAEINSLALSLLWLSTELGIVINISPKKFSHLLRATTPFAVVILAAAILYRDEFFEDDVWIDSESRAIMECLESFHLWPNNS